MPGRFLRVPSRAAAIDSERLDLETMSREELIDRVLRLRQRESVYEHHRELRERRVASLEQGIHDMGFGMAGAFRALRKELNRVAGEIARLANEIDDQLHAMESDPDEPTEVH